MRQLILGLDLGPNSIGWALVEEDDSGPKSLEAIGVRVFQEMVDRQKKTPKNHKRRDARQARRQRSRRKMRRDTLQNELVRCGLLPESAEEREALFHRTDPYEIRKRGLDNELAPHELGRAIFHLNQRRGFLSNRKVRDTKDKKKEDGVVKQEIGELKKEISESGSRTLGEFLSDQPKKRNRRTDRKMYEDEFDVLWKKQTEFHPELLTDALRARMRKILFFQRPLKLQKDLVGKCTFEPHKKRCPWCRPEAQWFRALQDVNHLEVRDPESGGYRPLRQDEREEVKKQLREKKTLTWNGARKALGLHLGETFNIEDRGEGGKKHLIGSVTLVDVRKILMKKTWEAMPQNEQDEFLEDLFSIQKEEALLKRLEEHWQLTREQADALLNTEFQPGYASLSLRAIRRITPHLERGRNYHDACRAAGYQHDYEKEIDANDVLPPAPDIRNPIVQKALNEVRRVVNAIIRKYGKPTRIRVELARDLKLGQKQKARLNAQNRKNRDLNEEARKLIAEVEEFDNGENRLRFRLWKEQKGLCPYTGRSIGARDIFSREYEVDHILPYSRTLDDSYMNKVLSLASANRDKGNRTPLEWMGGDPQMRQRISSMKDMPYSKRRRFDQKEIKTDEFISRQLNDTRYISREVSSYLKGLGADIQITTGQATAALRRSWGLNAILAVDSDMEKNRADHRHHAIDALVVALTDRKLFYFIANLSAEVREILGKRRFPLPDPWPDFMGEVREKVEAIVVSHQPLRKISGAFHEETALGRISHEGRDVFVRRIPLEELTSEAKVKRIVDRRIRELVQERLEAHIGNAKAAFASPLYLEHSRKGAGKTQIKTARVAVAENKTIDSLYPVTREGEEKPFKYYELGNNHHIEIIEHVETGKREGVVVSAMEAARRARRERTPIVQRDHGEAWRFVMSLSINDLVKLDAPVNGCDLYRVQAISPGDIRLRAHKAATIDDDATLVRIRSLKNLRVKKMSVDPLGKLETAHD